MNMQACDDFAKADAALNDSYKQIIAKDKEDALFLDGLKKAQRAWTAFRDAEVDANFPLEENQDLRGEYGSMYPMLYCTAQTDLTNQRRKTLESWLKDGAPYNIQG
jgi:uncharacterized protein YecT (DUF1311 family)